MSPVRWNTNVSTEPHTVEVTLTAAPTQVSLVSGVMTPVYAYNGRFPGPLLDVHEGDKVIVHFHNNLPEMTTVHWHGLYVPAVADGSPFYPVAPGRQYDYVFTIQPGTAGTYWYHPHPDQMTGMTRPRNRSPLAMEIRFRSRAAGLEVEVRCCQPQTRRAQGVDATQDASLSAGVL